MSVNKAIVVGRLGQDPEVKFTPSGQAVCNFSVATSEAWTDKSGAKQEKTEWHRIVVWGKQAENCGQYLSKGKQVYLEGSLQTRSWEVEGGDKIYTTEIVARSVQFLGDKSSGQDQGQNQSQSQGQNQRPVNQQQNQSAMNNNFSADDIPF